MSGSAIATDCTTGESTTRPVESENNRDEPTNRDKAAAIETAVTPPQNQEEQSQPNPRPAQTVPEIVEEDPRLREFAYFVAELKQNQELKDSDFEQPASADTNSDQEESRNHLTSSTDSGAPVAPEYDEDELGDENDDVTNSEECEPSVPSSAPQQYACDSCRQCLEFQPAARDSFQCGNCGCSLIAHIEDGDRVDEDYDAEDYQAAYGEEEDE